MSEPTPFATITSTVSQRIGSSNDAVKERVIEHLVEVEVKRRTELVVQAVSEVSKLKKALDKIHPDIKSYNEDGSEATSAWSKSKLEERKKATEALSKVEKALDKALSKGDYGDLLNVKFGGGKDESASNSLQAINAEVERRVQTRIIPLDRAFDSRARKTSIQRLLLRLLRV